MKKLKEKFNDLIIKYPNDADLGAAVRLAALIANKDITDKRTISTADISILEILLNE